jgi:hypothetical protein
VCRCLSLHTPLFRRTKIEEVIKTFNAVSADAAKLEVFCEMTKVMDAMGAQSTHVSAIVATQC